MIDVIQSATEWLIAAPIAVVVERIAHYLDDA